MTNNGNIFGGGNNNNHSTTGCNRNSNGKSMQDDMSSISGLHHAAAQHSLTSMGLTLMGNIIMIVKVFTIIIALKVMA